MSYTILKQLIPEMLDIPEELQYIDWCTCIEGDEKFIFNTFEEAEIKKQELLTDVRYVNRKLKIKHIV
jgi:hypothetical protein